MSDGTNLAQRLRDIYPAHPIVMDAAAEIDRLRDALDGIMRHCGENGADRGGRWAAYIASHVLNGGTYWA
jgi:hypothetical protein